MDVRIARVIELLETTSSQDLWFGGATPMGSLRGVTWQTALWKPAPDRHSIWELALHMAYWKYAVTRHFTGGPRGSFPREPANWPAVPDQPDARSWTRDRHLLRDEHEALCNAAHALGEVGPHDPVPSKPRWSWLQLLEGIHMHDTYHTGQIQIMKRLHRSLIAD